MHTVTTQKSAFVRALAYYFRADFSACAITNFDRHFHEKNPHSTRVASQHLRTMGHRSSDRNQRDLVI